MRNNDLPDFSVCLEATHHGPDVSVPVLNLEIGSNQEAWEDEKAAEVIVKVVQDILANFKPNKRDASIVVGGDHYMRNIVPLMQNRLGNQEIINDKIVIGHMCPSNQVDNFTKETLAEAISKTDVLVKDVIIDLAAVGQHALRLKKIITNAGLEVKYLHKIIVSD
ncbi:MAG: D-aminoacyl-tRNA deacylase [Nanoarchaeota archaeon]|nr:D-aminoacyl-tRNA deacylase [Nanoarchaeota archaeon]